MLIYLEMEMNKSSKQSDYNYSLKMFSYCYISKVKGFGVFGELIEIGVYRLIGRNIIAFNTHVPLSMYR